MTWLYVPSACSTDTAASSSDSDSPDSTYKPWLVLSGTVTQRPYSWRGWKKRPWIKRLSGTTSPPSTVARGAAAWISSLPVSTANRSLRRGNVAVSMTSDGSGETLPGSSLTWDPDSCSWRTSPDLFGEGFLTSAPSLPPAGSMRNGVCSQRPPLAPLTADNDSGSSHGIGYASPIAGDAKANGNSAEARAAGWNGMWPTPRASEGHRGTDPERPGRTGGPSLKQVIEHGRHDPTTGPDGNTGSNKADLNPRFVAALMGVPWDWLNPCTPVATDLYHEWQRKHSPPWRLELETGA